MPLYRYRPVNGPCRLCGDGYEVFQKEDVGNLMDCSKCGLKMERITGHHVHSPKILKPLSISDAKQSGFTVYRKSSQGEYERQ